MHWHAERALDCFIYHELCDDSRGREQHFIGFGVGGLEGKRIPLSINCTLRGLWDLRGRIHGTSTSTCIIYQSLAFHKPLFPDT